MVFSKHGVVGGPRSKKRIAPKTKQQKQEVFKEEVTVEVIVIQEPLEEIDPILEEDKDYNPLEDFDFQVPVRARKKNKKSKKN
jgi:hypothetical protein